MSFIISVTHGSQVHTSLKEPSEVRTFIIALISASSPPEQTNSRTLRPLLWCERMPAALLWMSGLVMAISRLQIPFQLLPLAPWMRPISLALVTTAMTKLLVLSCEAVYSAPPVTSLTKEKPNEKRKSYHLFSSYHVPRLSKLFNFFVIFVSALVATKEVISPLKEYLKYKIIFIYPKIVTFNKINNLIVSNT